MHKDFDAWNKLKKTIDANIQFPFASPREIWWCALGLNVGVEINGKHEQFERPVIIIRAYNTEMLKVVPLTTRVKSDRFHLAVSSDATTMSCAVLSQSRVVSARRLLRKIGKISRDDFEEIRKHLRDLDV